MKYLIILIALTAAAQYPPSSSNARTLGGLPACTATVTVNCHRALDSSGNFSVGGTVLGGPTFATTGLEGAAGTASVLSVTDNGLARVAQTRPNAETKRIVIIGSSNAAGVGASTYANSWAGRFTTAMAARGWTVLNVSISGQGTASAIARFWTDVAPLKPDVVIHATAFHNDSKNFTTYTTNITRLIMMTRQIGAVPVVIGQYANGTFDATMFQAAKDVEAWKEKLGVATWDWFGVTADPSTGAWLTGLDSGDLIHPNDAGHAAQFGAIPLGLFDRLFMAAPDDLTLSNSWSWKWGDSATDEPLSVALESTAPSWTIAAWIKDGGATSRGLMAAYSGSTMIGRVRNSGGVISWLDSVNAIPITSTVSAALSRWHHVAVTYNATVNTTSLYVDGALIGTETPTVSHAINKVFFLTNGVLLTMTGGTVRQPVIYRTTLTANQIAGLAQGTIQRSGIEWYSGLKTLSGNTVSDIGTLAIGTAYLPQLTLTADAPRLSALTPSVESGSGAPSTTPVAIGDKYVDTTNAKVYVAKGTASSADWVIVN